MTSKKISVPFFENPSENGCVQAAYKMVLKYFFPEKNFSIEELEKSTAKYGSGATWPYAGDLWLVNELHMDVVSIRLFDDEGFAKDGVEYIRSFAGDKVAKYTKDGSDIPTEQERAIEYAQKIEVEKKAPTVDDIRSLFNDGYLVTLGLNYNVLDGKEGYVGHRVLVTGYSKRGVYMHDPRMRKEGQDFPEIPDRFVPYAHLEAAWAYPEEKNKLLFAYRLKK